MSSVATDADPLQRGFERILSQYGNAREHQRFGRTNPIWLVFERLASELKALEPIATSRHLTVKWSAGQGRWATVPWIAALDKRETIRISEGVYVIYLFRADLAGVFLTINQGASWALATGNQKEAFLALGDRAAKLRSRLGTLQDSDFDMSGAITLGSHAPLIRAYESSTIAAKYYARDNVPSDDSLSSDLTSAVAAYQQLVPTSRWLRPRSLL